MDAGLFEKAVGALRGCREVGGSLVVLTGAGVSKESGIPTFRDAQTGLWENFRPEDLATREGFLKNPGLVWSWYDFRRNKVWDAAPNTGHAALAEMEKLFPRFTLITQNVDNLHRQAGSANVLELHGNIFRYKCLERNHPVGEAYLPKGNRDETESERQVNESKSKRNEGENQGNDGEIKRHEGRNQGSADDSQEQTDAPPRCPMCGSYVRPDVVWFGEMLPEAVLSRAFEAASQATVMLVAGTSGVVQPAASLPVTAREAGATVIEVNPEMSALTPFTVDYFLQGPSASILPQLLEACRA